MMKDTLSFIITPSLVNYTPLLWVVLSVLEAEPHGRLYAPVARGLIAAAKASTESEE
jgi:hypothetical protein